MRRALFLSLVMFFHAGCPQPSTPETDAGTADATASDTSTPGIDARIDAPGCADGDGDGELSVACGGTDCDDTDPDRAPSHTEVCDAADVDEDCDSTTFGEQDLDGDDHFDAACCNGSECGDDCDDTAPGTNPDVPEVCDLLDNDCDTRIDEATTPVPWYPDTDGDLFGDPAGTPVVSCVPVPDHASVATDCDDTRASVSPSATEVCNGIDDNCTGTTDEGFGTNDYYPDCDNDLHGSESAAPVQNCAVPLARPECGAATGSWVRSHDDCDETNAARYPSALEICNGIDDDCDTLADDGTTPTTWCNDPARGLHTTSAACTAGACAVVSCAAPYLDCSSSAGCESDSTTSAANCTACGNVCTWGVCGGRCDPLEIDAGRSAVCARRASGAVVCWGGAYAIGDGVVRTGTPPLRVTRASAPVLSISSAVDVALGIGELSEPFGCAVTSGGDLWCWGAVGARFVTGNAWTPVDVADGALEVTASERLFCWRTLDAVVCENRFQRLTFAGVADAVQIALGSHDVCWRRADGTVRCSLGLEGRTLPGTPAVIDIPGLDDAVWISGQPNSTGGTSQFCAARSGGSVVCWSVNRTSGPSVLTAVPGATGAIGVTYGGAHACLWRANGTVACWGDNTRGQLGGGPGPELAEVPGITDASSVSAGFAGTCARRRTGVFCWGTNGDGELGLGTRDTSSHSTPTAVLAPL